MPAHEPVVIPATLGRVDTVALRLDCLRIAAKLHDSSPRDGNQRTDAALLAAERMEAFVFTGSPDGGRGLADDGA